MPLHYLPFKTNDRIVSAANNSPWMKKGETGTAVAILQQALVDYGIPMPGSTNGGVMDGMFGRETKDAISFLQGANNLSVDGIAGRDTFGCLDHFMTTGGTAQRPKRVTLHFRSLALTNLPFDSLLRNAQKVYAQYNIQIVFGSGKSCGLTTAEATKFKRLDGSCEWEITGGEYAELLRRGSSVPRNHICAFFISKFGEEDLLGCGGHLKNHPACIVAAGGNRYDLAHEVGHVLLTSSYEPVHHPSTGNLMYEYSNRPHTPVLDQSQLAKIRSSPCCV
jgi:hypothetical protein